MKQLGKNQIDQEHIMTQIYLLWKKLYYYNYYFKFIVRLFIISIQYKLINLSKFTVIYLLRMVDE